MPNTPPPIESNCPTELTRADLYKDAVPFVQQSYEHSPSFEQPAYELHEPMKESVETESKQIVSNERIIDNGQHSSNLSPKLSSLANSDSDDSISRQFQPPLPRSYKQRKTIRKLTSENVGDIHVSSQIMSPDSPTSPFDIVGLTSPKVKPVSLDLESMKHKNSNTSSASEITNSLRSANSPGRRHQPRQPRMGSKLSSNSCLIKRSDRTPTGSSKHSILKSTSAVISPPLRKDSRSFVLQGEY